MLLLKPGQIDIWLTFLNDIQTDELWSRYKLLLSEQEEQQRKQFHFDRDRSRYLVTRALVRTVLSKYAPLEPLEWTFSSNRYGKPKISNIHSLAQKISFNISHTDGLIMVGVTLDNAIGVDTENTQKIKAPKEGLESILAPQEIQSLSQLPSADYPSAFFTYWTLKEAYIKARGEGLSLPLQNIRFQISENGVNFHPSCHDDPQHWHFWQFEVQADYLIAICVQRQINIVPQIYLKTIIPLQSEADMQCILLRQS